MGGLQASLRQGYRLWLAVCVGSIWAGPAWAVTVILRSDNQPIYGYLVEESPARVIVRVPLPNGGAEERVLPRQEIQLLYNPVDVSRLEALDPARPQEYRDFAEELAEKKLDPEARHLSMRLYCLAAHLDPERFGRSAALGIMKLAATESERRRYRIMAYLLDGGRDRSLLDGIESPGASPVPQDPSHLAACRVLEAWRRGSYREALQGLRRPEVSAALDRIGGPISAEAVRLACTGRGPSGPPPSDEVAYQILVTQRTLLAGWVASPRPDSWAALTKDDLREVALPLTLEKLLPFDPHAAVFRQGRWHRPDRGVRVDAISR